jgi:ATP-binding cassette, subfamily C, bacterial CydCD
LVGPSGAGKSTAAALALRIADPVEGRVTCGGIDLRDVDARAWRQRCAWVPQRARIFTGTVADNLRLGRPDATDAELLAALEAAGALSVVDALPAGLATPIGDGGRALSAGEAQRLTIARAFIRDAPLLVLDEPTAHLDEDHATDIGLALERLALGRTTLLIVHRPALAAIADHIVVLDHGHRVEQETLAATATPQVGRIGEQGPLLTAGTATPRPSAEPGAVGAQGSSLTSGTAPQPSANPRAAGAQGSSLTPRPGEVGAVGGVGARPEVAA